MKRAFPLLRNQGVAFLYAEMRQVDTGQRVGRLYPEKRTACHFSRRLRVFKTGRGISAPQVVNRCVFLIGNQLPMIFHHGFFGPGCSIFCATVLAIVIDDICGLATAVASAGFCCGTGTDVICGAGVAGAACCGAVAMAVGWMAGVAGRISGAPGFSADAGESDGGSRVTFRRVPALHSMRKRALLPQDPVLMGQGLSVRR